MYRVFTTALIVLAAGLAGCGDDDESTAAERICQKVDNCSNVYLKVSYDECVDIFEDVSNQTTDDCANCIADLNCSEIGSLIGADPDEVEKTICGRCKSECPQECR